MGELNRNKIILARDGGTFFRHASEYLIRVIKRLVKDYAEFTPLTKPID
jgi:hypothetical protein